MTPADAVPVRHRWTALTISRLALVSVAALTVALLPEQADGRVGAVLATCAVYAAVVLVAEALRRRRDARGIALMGALLVVDALFLVKVVNDTGGIASPLNALVYLQIAAVTLIVSLRVGIQAAAVHAAVVVLAALSVGTSIVAAPLGVDQGGAALRSTTYLLVAIATAAFASIDQRALRRSQVHLTGQVELLSDLDATHTPVDAAFVLGHHLVDALGFTRAAVAVLDDDIGRIVVVSRAGEDVHHVIAEVPSSLTLAGLDLRRPGSTLLGSLDPATSPTLDRLLPDNRDLVVAPLEAGGTTYGAIVGEWAGGPTHEIDLDVVDEVTVTARFGGVALRSAFLLAEVEERSRRDLVTGLGNRRFFEEAIERETSRLHRTGGELSVILVDLDRFKKVNDEHGHLVGDAVLKLVGEALTESGRAHDVVARIGGDEFALLLADCGLDDARTVAERARLAVWDAVGDRGVSACAGVATAPTHGSTARELVQRADQALYSAKDDGRNRVATAPVRRADVVVDLTAPGADHDRGRPTESVERAG